MPSISRRFSLASQGFTIAELITVCAIITILAVVALSVAKFGIRRQKEIELRETLRRITSPIDKWHDYKVAGRLKGPFSIDQGDYPKELKDSQM